MATYKVPQDVEAEDKLIGPFSFRQFIYLIVAALSGFLAYGLWNLFWGIGLIPLPITLFFLVMALPLKKDQPMETYITAIVQFLLKPRVRLWNPEGELTLVEITAPKVDERPLTKNFSGNEASQRLQYLSQIVDTGGWASRGLTSAADNLYMSDTFVAEAQSAEDMFDPTAGVTQQFNTMIAQSDEAHKQAMLQSVQSNLHPSTNVPTPIPTQQASPSTPQPTTDSSSHVVFNPYPSSIHQRVIAPQATTQARQPAPASQPARQPAAQQAQASSEKEVSPDIIRLATNKDLSISTIAREAERLQKKHLDEEEVVVSLR